jgi:hypothetical protein
MGKEIQFYDFCEREIRSADSVLRTAHRVLRDTDSVQNLLVTQHRHARPHDSRHSSILILVLLTY